MRLPIVKYGDPVLRAKGRRVAKVDERIRELAATKQSSLALQADKKASFGMIIKVMDALKLAGVKNLPAFTHGEK